MRKLNAAFAICRYFPVRRCRLIIVYTFDFKTGSAGPELNGQRVTLVEQSGTCPGTCTLTASHACAAFDLACMRRSRKVKKEECENGTKMLLYRTQGTYLVF